MLDTKTGLHRKPPYRGLLILFDRDNVKSQMCQDTPQRAGTHGHFTPPGRRNAPERGFSLYTRIRHAITAEDNPLYVHSSENCVPASRFPILSVILLIARPALFHS